MTIRLIPFKIAVPKSKKKVSEVKRTSNKIVQGKVIKEDDIYKVTIDLKNDEHYPDLLVLEFTDRSFNLTNRLEVFSRNPDSNNRYIRFIRNAVYARFMPGLPEQYVPFAPNKIVKGYIVKEENKVRFDFKDLVYPEEYDKNQLSDSE